MSATETKELHNVLGLKVEAFRDTLGTLVQSLMWTVSDAYVLVGEADLMVDPSSDELWRAKALRALGDVEYAEMVVGALREHLNRDEPEVERILIERRGGESVPADIAERLRELRSEIDRLKGDEDGGAL
jgi:hypothetical protein